ncbi:MULTISPECIES: SHOCT domain-containing protein [Amycolatopsis]
MRSDEMPYWNHMNAGWGPPALLLSVLLAVTLVVLVAVLLRGSRARPEDKALRILDERFARGEIDQEEYERRRAALLE